MEERGEQMFATEISMFDELLMLKAPQQAEHHTLQ